MTLRFTCGERKICLTIKKPQNFMDMIVCKISFCFLCLYNSFNCLIVITVKFWLEFTLSF